MLILEKTRWLAIHQVFLAQRVDVGCTLSLKTLWDEWKVSGLRQSDLSRGVETLVANGYLGLEAAIDGPRVRLKDESFGLLRSDPMDDRALETLLTLRRRKRLPDHLIRIVSQPRNRRSADRAEAAAA
jgi:hypothetical protein